nr:hypothetical protein [Mycoplasmopsis canis]WQQ12163.1 hypothetical protein RRG48_02070 [Mycoplasmopsis canis]
MHYFNEEINSSYHRNYSYIKNDETSNFILESDTPKDINEELNFNIELFNTANSRKPYLFLKIDKVIHNKARYISHFVLKINKNHVIRVKREDKLIVNLNELLKDSEKLDYIELQFFDISNKYLGKYEIYLKEKDPNSIVIKSNNKNHRIKLSYSSIFNIKDGIETKNHRFLNIYFSWNDIKAGQKVYELANIIYYFDFFNNNLKKMFDPTNQYNIISNISFKIPHFIKDKNGIKLKEEKKKENQFWKSKFVINEDLITNNETGEVLKADNYISKKVLEIPLTSLPYIEYSLNFEALGTNIVFKNSLTQDLKHFYLKPKKYFIKESNKLLDKAYSFKISDLQLNNILFSGETNWTINDYLIKRRNEY